MEADSDGEWGDQTVYTTHFRIYNPVIGRFFSIDPAANRYPDYSPYAFSLNSPILLNDPNGDCPTKDCDTYNNFLGGGTVSIPSGSKDQISYGGTDLYSFTYKQISYSWNSNVGGYVDGNGNIYNENKGALTTNIGDPRYLKLAKSRANELGAEYNDVSMQNYTDLTGDQVASIGYDYSGSNSVWSWGKGEVYSASMFPDVDLGTSLIPIYGSYQEASNAWSDGRYGSAGFYGVMAISDIFMVKSAYTFFTKGGLGALKLGNVPWYDFSTRWTNPGGSYRAFYGSKGFAKPKQNLHHWFIHQTSPIGKNVPGIIKHQMWNLVPMPMGNPAIHNLLHGKGVLMGNKYAPLIKFYYGTPTYIKAAPGSVGFRLLDNEN